MPFFAAIKTRPVMEVVESVATLVAFVGLGCGLVYHGHGQDLLLHWLLPQRLAVLILAYFFDYVPHRPHKSTREQSAYAHTSKVTGVTSYDPVNFEPVLNLLMLYQTYHNIHHQHAQVPFYRYMALWNKYSNEYIAAGTPLKPIYDETRPMI